MKRFRDPHWALIFLFLGIIAAVPLVQTLKESGTEEGIRALELFSATPTAENLRSYEENLEKASWAARFTRPWLQFANFTWLKEGGEKAVIAADDWYFYKPGLKYMLGRPPAASLAEGTNDPVRAIVEFRDQLASWGIQLLVMPVPNKDSIYPDRLTSRARNIHSVMTPRTRDVLDRLRTAGVEVVDLFKTFSEAREPNGSQAPGPVPLYLAQDTHWSPEGVSLAARTVARRLTDLGWVRPGWVEYSERNAPVKRLGDIVRMLQVPMIDHSIKPEDVASVQVIRCADGHAYKDELEAEVLVLGDSFMRIYQQDEPNSAGFIAHLAKELKQPMMSLVNDGGGSTLVREELCARPVFLKNKKVVLWEFVERDIGLGIKGWRHTQLPPSPLPAPGSAVTSLTKHSQPSNNPQLDGARTKHLSGTDSAD